MLDTVTLSLYRRGDEATVAFLDALPANEVAISVITVEEQISGWFALLRRARTRAELASTYQLLTDTVQRLSALHILPFDEAAIARYEQLRALRLNVGGNDLRIAAIALENDAIVVTRNRRDFERVPSLVVEDWTV